MAIAMRLRSTMVVGAILFFFIVTALVVYSVDVGSINYTQEFSAYLDVAAVQSNVFNYVIKSFIAEMSINSVQTNDFIYSLPQINSYYLVGLAPRRSVSHSQSINANLKIYLNESGEWVLVYSSKPTTTVTSTTTTSATTLPVTTIHDWYIGGGGAPVPPSSDNGELSSELVTHTSTGVLAPFPKVVTEVQKVTNWLVSRSGKTALLFFGFLLVVGLVLISGSRGKRRVKGGGRRRR